MKHFLVKTQISMMAMLVAVAALAAPALNRAGGMVELKGSDIALELDGVQMTRDSLLFHLRQLHAIPEDSLNLEELKQVGQLVNGLNPQQQRAVCQAIYHLVRQQLLVHAAKDAGITVTDEDRRVFAQNWAENHPGEDVTEMLGKLKETADTPLSLTRNDVFLIYKWTEQKLAPIVPSDRQVQEVLARFRQISDTFGQQSAAEQREFAKLASRPEIHSDEGFAELAREYSDGMEADQGGLFPELMTRSEIAAANFDQPFTTPVGETSPMIETPTSLRYIRVLKEFPAAMPGEPPKLQVAQILYSKRVLDNLPTEEQIRTDLKYQLQQQYIHSILVNELAPKFHFRCPLIPNLLELGNPQKLDEERLAELAAAEEADDELEILEADEEESKEE